MKKQNTWGNELEKNPRTKVIKQKPKTKQPKRRKDEQKS